MHLRFRDPWFDLHRRHSVFDKTLFPHYLVQSQTQSAMIGCLRTHVRTDVRKEPIIALYFEFENELKFYNLGAWLNPHD